MKFSFYKFGVVLLLLFPLFFMTGCTVNIPFVNQPSSEPYSLSYESLWESEGTYSDIFNKFKEQNPLATINYNNNSQIRVSVYKEDLITRLKSGQNVPDVIRIHISWLEEFKPYLQGEVFPQAEFDNKYYPGVASAVAEKVVDKPEYLVFGLPMYYDALVLVYNKDHFTESGIRAVPTTWEQFFNTASQLSRKDEAGTILRSGASFGNQDLEFYTDIFGYLLSSTGLVFPDGLNGDLDTLRSVLRVLNRSTDWNTSFANSGTSIASRNSSMAILPMWRVNDIITSNSTLNLGIAPLPQADIANPVIWPTYYIDVVPKASKNSKNSWNLLKFMASDESTQSIYSKQASTRRLPSLPAVADFPNKTQVDPFLKELSSYAKTATSPHFDGSAVVFSDRAGNDFCVERIKATIVNNNAEALINSLPLIQEVCLPKNPQ